jgi:hypothetical protein
MYERVLASFYGDLVSSGVVRDVEALRPFSPIGRESESDSGKPCPAYL